MSPGSPLSRLRDAVRRRQCLTQLTVFMDTEGLLSKLTAPRGDLTHGPSSISLTQEPVRRQDLRPLPRPVPLAKAPGACLSVKAAETLTYSPQSPWDQQGHIYQGKCSTLCESPIPVSSAGDRAKYPLSGLIGTKKKKIREREWTLIHHVVCAHHCLGPSHVCEAR